MPRGGKTERTASKRPASTSSSSTSKKSKLPPKIKLSDEAERAKTDDFDIDEIIKRRSQLPPGNRIKSPSPKDLGVENDDVLSSSSDSVGTVSNTAAEKRDTQKPFEPSGVHQQVASYTFPYMMPYAPGMAPMMAPGMTPMMAPGMTPMMAPGMTPMMAPGMTPMMAPGMTPTTDQEHSFDRINTIEEAVMFYLKVRDMVLDGHSKHSAFKKLSKQNASFYRIEGLAKLYFSEPRKFIKVRNDWSKTSKDLGKLSIQCSLAASEKKIREATESGLII